MRTRNLWCLLSALVGVGAAYLAYHSAPEMVARLVPVVEAAKGADTIVVGAAVALATFALVGGGLAMLSLGLADIWAVGGAVDRLRRLEGADRRPAAEILRSLGDEPVLAPVAAAVAVWLRAEQEALDRERRPLAAFTLSLVSDGLRYRRLVPIGAGLVVLAGIALAGLAILDAVPGWQAGGDQSLPLATAAARLSAAAMALMLPVFAAAMLLVGHLAIGEALAGRSHHLFRSLARLLPLADTDLSLRQLDRGIREQFETLIRAVEGGYVDLGRQIEAAAGSGDESGVARDVAEIRSLLMGLSSELKDTSTRIADNVGPLTAITGELREVLRRLQDLSQRLAEIPVVTAAPMQGTDPADLAQAIEELVVENEQAVRRLPRI